MSYKLYSDEEKRLQRKLIPLNLVVAILALVAAVSLLITPLLKVNFGKALSSLGENEEMAQYAEMGEALDVDLEINPLDMAKVLIAPKEEKGAVFFSKLLIDNGLLEEVLVSVVNVSLAAQVVEELDVGGLDMASLNEALRKIDGVKSSEEAVAVLDDYLTVLEGQLDVTIDDDMKDAARENCVKLYTTTVEATGGSFSVEAMLCVNISAEGDAVYTNYADLLVGAANADADSEEGIMAVLSTATGMINGVAVYYGYGFIFVAFHVLMWFILFLFAFFRTFAKNKRFTMWYVKLVSCWPCIIFWGLISVGMTKIAAAVSAIAPYAGVFAAFSSFTWISGICYLLLWALSIFWAFPIKRKIRKLRKGK